MASSARAFERSLPWLVRAGWVAMPFAAGPALAAAFDERSATVQRAGSALLWVGWAVVACASLVHHPVSLTIIRCGAPAAVAASIASSPAGAAGARLWIAVIVAVLVAAVAFLPETAMPYMNGPAYPNERRFPLRAPGALLAGLLPAAWVVAVVVPAAGVLLLAAKQWLAGGAALAAGIPAAVLLARSIHTLSRRWIVFVPAGVVVHDPMQLADPVLFRRRDITSLAPAAAGTDATDLTARTFGLALELDVREPVSVAFQKPGARAPELRTVSKLLFTPTRPGAVLAEARARRVD